MPKELLTTGLLVAGLTGAAPLTWAQTLPAAPAAAAPAPATPAAAEPLLPPGQVHEPYKAYLRRHYAADNQARAVVHLFGRKQTAGLLWLLGGSAATAYVASVSGTHSSSSGGTYTVNVSPVGYGVLVGLTLGVGGGKLLRFSNQKLFEALQMHDLTRSFPDYVENKLRDRDYKN